MARTIVRNRYLLVNVERSLCFYSVGKVGDEEKVVCAETDPWVAGLVLDTQCGVV